MHGTQPKLELMDAAETSEEAAAVLRLSDAKQPHECHKGISIPACGKFFILRLGSLVDQFKASSVATSRFCVSDPVFSLNNPHVAVVNFDRRYLKQGDAAMADCYFHFHEYLYRSPQAFERLVAVRLNNDFCDFLKACDGEKKDATEVDGGRSVLPDVGDRLRENALRELHRVDGLLPPTQRIRPEDGRGEGANGGVDAGTDQPKG